MKISIVTVCLNSENSIEKTIKSVISKPTQNVDNENLNKEINQLRDISKYDESFQNEVEISSSLGATESESLEQNSGDLLSARLPIENGEIDKKEENQKIVYDGDDGISEIRNEAIHFSDDRETDIDIKKSKRRVRKLNKKLPINKLRSNRRLVLIILITILLSEIKMESPCLPFNIIIWSMALRIRQNYENTL